MNRADTFKFNVIPMKTYITHNPHFTVAMPSQFHKHIHYNSPYSPSISNTNQISTRLLEWTTVLGHVKFHFYNIIAITIAFTDSILIWLDKEFRKPACGVMGFSNN